MFIRATNPPTEDSDAKGNIVKNGCAIRSFNTGPGQANGQKSIVRFKKIHLGCGSNFIHGWDNIDIVMGDGIIVHDLRESLPYKSEIIGTIFMEHVIEHLDKDHGYKLLSDCFRILRSGGVMRIGWPDLSRLIKAYVLRRRNYKDFVIPFLNDINKTGTWDEILSDCLFSWDHKYAYTKEIHVYIID